jgi:hypothetical protein
MYVQDTILVVPPYPYCIEEDLQDVPSPTPFLDVAPAANMVGRVPLIPLSLADNSTPTIPQIQQAQEFWLPNGQL